MHLGVYCHGMLASIQKNYDFKMLSLIKMLGVVNIERHHGVKSLCQQRCPGSGKNKGVDACNIDGIKPIWG